MTGHAEARIRRYRWPRLRDDRGASSVELAVIAAVMISLTFLVVQAAMVYYAQYIALGAATQGADAARGYQAGTEAGASQAQGFLDQAGWGLRDQQVRVSLSADGSEVRVTVTGQAVRLLPFLTFHIAQSAHRSVEQTTP